jgi:hypothetical protein
MHPPLFKPHPLCKQVRPGDAADARIGTEGTEEWGTFASATVLVLAVRR